MSTIAEALNRARLLELVELAEPPQPTPFMHILNTCEGDMIVGRRS